MLFRKSVHWNAISIKMYIGLHHNNNNNNNNNNDDDDDAGIGQQSSVSTCGEIQNT